MLDHWVPQARKRAEPFLRQLERDNVATISLVGLAERLRLTEAGARQLASRLMARGELSRLLPGLYRVNRVKEGPEVVAHAIHWAVAGNPYWLGYDSAIAAHLGELRADAPVFRVGVHGLMRPRTMETGAVIQLVQKPAGLAPRSQVMALAGIGKLPVGSPETTILESLHRPQLAGGILPVARLIGRLRSQLDVARLVREAIQLESGAALRRLGALLELAGASRETVAPLRKQLNATFSLLDPTQPRAGYHLDYWKLRLNIPLEQVTATIQNTPVRVG